MIPYREVTIDLNPQLLPPEPLLTASQYDNGRPVKVKIKYNGADFDLTGMTAQISVRKPSGKVVIANATEVTGSTVIFNLITQMTAEYGMIPTEISLTGQNQDPIGTANWITYVEKSPSSGSPSDTWVQDLDEKVEQATEAAEAAEASEINAEAWAVGERGGVPVTELDPTYHNNSKYWAEYAEEAVQDVTDLVERAETAAGAAADSATESAGYASDSAASATASAGSATESAGYATQSSQYATNSANSATASATSASASAQSAGQSAASATESAGYATSSENYAGISAGAAEAAGQSATAAAGSASTAAGHATNAANSATASAGSAAQSANSATASATSAGQAAGSATAAAGSADAADASADRAQEILDSIPEDYSELSDDVTALKSAFDDLEETVNGEFSRNYTEGKNFTANSGSHSIIDDADACISDYIPVTWGTDKVAFWYTDDAEDDTVYQIWFFDANKDFVSYAGRNPTGTNYRSITTPSNVSFARISFKKGFAGRLTENSLTPLTIYYTATETITASGLVQKIGNLTNLKTEEKTNIVGAVNEVVDDIFGRKAELSTSISSGGINKSVDFSAETGDKIYVLPSGTAFKNTDCYIYFRYSGESSNTNMGKVDLGKKTYFTLAKDLVTVFVYDTSSNAQAGTVNLVVGIDGVEDEVEKNASDINILKGKKINFLGDSLTHGPGEDNSNSYTTFLVNEYGCTTRNYGIIGSTVQYDENRNPMCVRYADMDNDADIVAFMGGTNDYWNNKPLGQFGDTTYDTFFGALDVLISGLIAKYPTAFVYAVTPPHGYGPNFTGDAKTNAGSMQDIADAVKQVAEKYSIPVLDVFNAGGLYPKISAQADVYYNSSDGVHLTVAGQKKLANLHATFIKAHYCG